MHSLRFPLNQVAAGEVKSKNEYVTFEEYFHNDILAFVESRLRKEKNRPTQLLLVPSLRDAHFPHCVLPQPPFTSEKKKEVSIVLYYRYDDVMSTNTCPDFFYFKALPSSLSNPSTFEVEGVTVGVTSYDILSDMSAMLYESYVIPFL